MFVVSARQARRRSVCRYDCSCFLVVYSIVHVRDDGVTGSDDRRLRSAPAAAAAAADVAGSDDEADVGRTLCRD